MKVKSVVKDSEAKNFGTEGVELKKEIPFLYVLNKRVLNILSKAHAIKNIVKNSSIIRPAGKLPELVVYILPTGVENGQGGKYYFCCYHNNDRLFGFMYLVTAHKRNSSDSDSNGVMLHSECEVNIYTVSREDVQDNENLVKFLMDNNLVILYAGTGADYKVMRDVVVALAAHGMESFNDFHIIRTAKSRLSRKLIPSVADAVYSFIVTKFKAMHPHISETDAIRHISQFIANIHTSIPKYATAAIAEKIVEENLPKYDPDKLDRDMASKISDHNSRISDIVSLLDSSRMGVLTAYKSRMREIAALLAKKFPQGDLPKDKELKTLVMASIRQLPKTAPVAL